MNIYRPALFPGVNQNQSIGTFGQRPRKRLTAFRHRLQRPRREGTKASNNVLPPPVRSTVGLVGLRGGILGVAIMEPSQTCSNERSVSRLERVWNIFGDGFGRGELGSAWPLGGTMFQSVQSAKGRIRNRSHDCVR